VEQYDKQITRLGSYGRNTALQSWVILNSWLWNIL